MISCCPTKRKLARQKGIITRRANKLRKEELKKGGILDLEQASAKIRADEKIKQIELNHFLSENVSSLCKKRLLTEDEIIGGAFEFSNITGVYFLIEDNRVKYVGQSVNIFNRISQHISNRVSFDKIAFISCEKEIMDKLESLYIHMLKPCFNGKNKDGNMNAPMTIDELLK